MNQIGVHARLDIYDSLSQVESLKPRESIVRFIEIDVDGVIVRAQLNEEGAPKTVDAIWNALPFQGRAVHAQLSGDMFRMLDETPIGDLETESEEAHQHPGSVVYYPPIKEIAFGYGETRFQGQAAPVYLTPFAEIEGDIEAFGKKADQLLDVGTVPITFRKAADQTTPFQYRTFAGPKIEVEFDGVKLVATVLESMAPKAAKSFLEALPFEGVGKNDDWGGGLTRLYPKGNADGTWELETSDADQRKFQVWPGYIYYDVLLRRVSICYADASATSLAGIRPTIPLAVFDGDWSAYKAKAKAQLTEGAKPISIKKLG
jgi:hypothetical protein